MSAAIYLLNQSTLLTDADGDKIGQACAAQLAGHVAPAWGMAPCEVHFVPRGVAAPAGGYNILITDEMDDPQAAGWHTDDDSGIHGQVGVKVWLDNGGTVLSGPNSVSVTCSHEVAELFCNRAANEWRDTGNGWSMVNEVCDSCEGDSYDIEGVSVSNFLHPEYFDPYTRRGVRLDHLGKLTQVFTADTGGYFVWQSETAQPQQHFAEAVPQFVRDLKAHEATRIQRIIAKASHGPGAA